MKQNATKLQDIMEILQPRVIHILINFDKEAFYKRLMQKSKFLHLMIPILHNWNSNESLSCQKWKTLGKQMQEIMWFIFPSRWGHKYDLVFHRIKKLYKNLVTLSGHLGGLFLRKRYGLFTNLSENSKKPGT